MAQPSDTVPGSEGVEPPRTTAGRLKFPPFEIDVRAHQLLRDGVPVALTPKAFDTLLVLAMRRGQVVSKDEMMRAVWNDTHVSEESLVQSISLVRKALGDDSAQPTYIATIAKRGYRFVAAVEEEGEPASAPIVPSQDQPATSSIRPNLLRAAALVAGLAVAAALGASLIRGEAPGASSTMPQVRLQFPGPRGTTLASGGTLSPDARQMAFVARDEGSRTTRLWSLNIETGEATRVPGSEGASKPFWSPDSTSIAFFADGHLKIARPGASTPHVLATSGITPAGGSWSINGTILFASSQAGISAVSADGGAIRVVTSLNVETQESGHEAPQWLPDGRHFLYFVVSPNRAQSGTYVAAIDESAPPRRLLDGTASQGNYSPDGYLMFVRDRTLFAQPLDLDTLALTGTATRIATDVTAPARSTNGVLSAAKGGLIAFGGAPHERLAWYDRTGAFVGAPAQTFALRNPRVSRDARFVVGNGPDMERRGIWSLDVGRNTVTRVTSEGRLAVLSPDGNSLVFNSDRLTGAGDLYVRSLTGPTDELVLKSPEPKFLQDWSADGRYIVYVSGSGARPQHLWLLPRFGDGVARPFIESDFNEIQGQVSPDSRWIAYTSDESGRWEVYVQSFPSPGMKWIVSTDGGAQPHWRGDGRELYYIDRDGTLMAVTVSGTDRLTFSRPQRLFQALISGEPVNFRNHYAVTADGQRFLFTAIDPAAGSDPITLLVNWTRQLAVAR